MATYGIDVYGQTLYGTPSGVQFSAAPFTVQPFEYGRLLLTWNNPPGDWAQFRLVRNPKGFPASYNDGDVLLDIRKITLADITPASPAQYDDSVLVPGRFYYYSIFVNDSSTDPGAGNWWRAGNAYNQAVADKGWRDRFWDYIPNQYKRLSPTTDLLDQIDQENYQLRRFLNVFAYHVDMLETQQEALLDINNPDNFSYAAIDAAGQQLGITTERELGPRIARSRIKNATYIDQQKGTTQGIQNLMSATSGWVVDVVEGQNYLLSADQSSFVNPTYPGWDQWTNWPTGAIVSYNGNLFQAKTGGAFGAAQAPALTRSNNTWWNVLFDFNTTAEYNPRTGGQSTWYSSYTGGGSGTAGTIRLGTGFQSATDSTQNTSNAYVITNTSGVTASMVTQSVAPVIAPTWSSATAYVQDNYVTFSGKVYRATKMNTNVTPGTNSAWALATGTLVTSPVIDPRQYIADGIPVRPADSGLDWIASYYIYATSNAVPVSASIDWFDAYGKFVCTVTRPTNPTEWDSFSYGALGSDINSAFPDRGPAWSGTAGNIARSGLGYVYRNFSTPGTSISVVDGFVADRTIGCTVRHFPTVGSANAGCGLIGRYSDSVNYLQLGGQSLVQYYTSKLPAPSALTLNTVGTAGSTTYFYEITAINSNGETIASSESSISTGNASLSGTNYVNVNWAAVSGATGYKIYRSTTTNTEGLIGTVGAVTNYHDTGGTKGAAPPVTNTAGFASNITLIDFSTLSPSQVFIDGDRMALKMVGSAVTVYRNGVSIWTGTMPFTNITSTKFGIWEAY